MKTHNLLSKWKINQVMNLKKASFLLFLGLATLAGVEATTLKATDSTSNYSEEKPLDFTLKINDVPELPSITLVDDKLNIVAQFYGDTNQLKKQFENVFENATLIAEYNLRRMYLISPKK
ncbi:MAG: hypothetical protein P8O16_05270 [Algoriphagus sp.]|jgi:hypothetical protein|uniref:hypothetical protein n=1 Tax=Algoriphagus sp. TaxID=1872435 RepID=UPI0026339646|nr:hypothetical protein [Algoriphagus sp.]MDG1276671.1 hypothetical protein [Algoriphagus sp.]